MPTIYTLSQIINALTTSWLDGTTPDPEPRNVSPLNNNVYYSLNTVAEWAGGPGANSLITMDATQANAARLAFRLWDDLVPFNIVETQDNPDAHVTFDYGTNVAHANYWVPSVEDFGTGTKGIFQTAIWFDAGTATNQDSFMAPGGYAFMAAIDEIGHSLGLSHPGFYNGSDDVQSPGSFSPAYAQDYQLYTVMSYFGYYDLAANGGKGGWVTGVLLPPSGYGVHPQTPMVDDIAAIQSKYGADTTTRATDTVYGFQSSFALNDPERAIYDFSVNTHPLLTIWDSGGVNTLNVSGYSGPQWISLVPGTYSSVDGMTSNVGIAYGTTIQKAIGGVGADTFTTTTGNLTIDGGKGGGNTLDYSWDGSGITVNLQQGSVWKGTYYTTNGMILVAHDAGTDTILNKSIQEFYGGNGADTFKSSADNSYTFHGGGGAGINTLDYGSVNDSVTFNVPKGQAVKASGASIDTFDHVQHFIGGAVHNLFVGAATGNYVFDGNGADSTLGYSGSTGISFDLLAGTASKGAGATDRFTDIQSFVGGTGSDTFYAKDGLFSFDGGSGTAINTLDYSSANNAFHVTVNLQNKTVEKFTTGFPLVDTITNIQRFVGTSKDDTFVSAFGSYRFDGSDGTNTLDYSWEPYKFTVTVANKAGTVGKDFPFAPFVLGSDSFANISHFIGGAGDDTFVSATDGSNYTFEGGGSHNTLDYSQANGTVKIDLQKGVAYKTSNTVSVVGPVPGLAPQIFDSFSGIETFKGTAGADTLIDGHGSHAFIGGLGTDVAVFHGAYKDYDFSQSYFDADNRWHTVVVDKVGTSGDGRLDLTGVEQMQFADGTFNIFPPIKPIGLATLAPATVGATASVPDTTLMGTYMASTFVAPGAGQTTTPNVTSTPTTQDVVLAASRH